MRIHTGVRPYKCTFCDRAFTQSNDLTLHIRRHTGDKPYMCGVCGDRFIQGTALQTHRRQTGHYEPTLNETKQSYSIVSVNDPHRVKVIGANEDESPTQPPSFDDSRPQPIAAPLFCPTETPTSPAPVHPYLVNGNDDLDVASMFHIQAFSIGKEFN